MKSSKTSEIGKTQQSEGLWTLRECAEYLGVSTSYLYKNKEKFFFVRYNWNIKFIPDAVKKQVNEMQRIPTSNS
jgi:hypothetical protein